MSNGRDKQSGILDVSGSTSIVYANEVRDSLQVHCNTTSGAIDVSADDFAVPDIPAQQLLTYKKLQAKSIPKPNGAAIPTPQEIQKNCERTESTRAIDAMKLKHTFSDASEPLLNRMGSSPGFNLKS